MTKQANRSSDIPGYRLVRSATRADVRRGMRVRWKEYDGKVVSGVVTGACEFWFRVGDGPSVWRSDEYASLPIDILSEPDTEPAEQLPRLVKGSELRVGDRVEHLGAVAYRNSVARPMDDCVVLITGEGMAWLRSGYHVRPTLAVRLLSRDNPVPSESEATNAKPLLTAIAASESCSRCAQPLARVRRFGSLCGDCFAVERKPVVVWTRPPEQQSRIRREMSAGAIYHLADDEDAQGCP